MRLIKSFDCTDCGAPTTRARDHGQPLICQACSERRVAVNVRSIATKQGPTWDRWAAGMQRWAAGLSAPGGAA